MVDGLASAASLRVSIPSLVLSNLLPPRRAVSLPSAGAGGDAFAGGGGGAPPPPPCIPPSLSLLVTMVTLPIPDLATALPLLDSFWTLLLLSLPPTLATSPAEPGGVPGAVHGGQVPRQQAGGEDQGAGNTPGVREDPSEASGGGFSLACLPASRAKLP